MGKRQRNRRGIKLDSRLWASLHLETTFDDGASHGCNVCSRGTKACSLPEPSSQWQVTLEPGTSFRKKEAANTCCPSTLCHVTHVHMSMGAATLTLHADRVDDSDVVKTAAAHGINKRNFSFVLRLHFLCVVSS